MTPLPTSHPIELPDFTDLSDTLRPFEIGRWADDWAGVHVCTSTWLAAHPGLLPRLRAWLRALPPDAAADIAAASRETTTHFAWRLAGRPGTPFSFWLHEYKPQREWLLGYANTVHNHRYHFCTTVLAGGVRHEWYDVVLDDRVLTGDAAPAAVTVRRRAREQWLPGAMRALTADQWHRIPVAHDGTLTFLVKSRPVRGYSVSVDPDTRRATRHLPVEQRIADLGDRI